MPLHIRLPRGPLAVQPGATLHCAVIVTNAGSRTEHVAPTVLGAAASWTSLHPTVLTLPPGGEGVLDAELHPPRVAHVRAGPLPFGVMAAAQDGPSVGVAEELVVVGSFADLTAELAPAVVPGRSGTTWLRLENRGNTARHVMVGGRDVDCALRVVCRPGGVTLYPGTRRSVRIRLRGRAAPRTGTPRPFEVVVRPVDDDPVVLRGTLLGRPWFPAVVAVRGAPATVSSSG
jgi:hypothetical protein